MENKAAAAKRGKVTQSPDANARGQGPGSARIRSAVERHPVCAKGSSTFLDALLSRALLKNFTKGQVVFTHQEEARRFYIVEKGWIKIYRETLDGTQAVVDILPAGYMFGETSIFENDCYPNSAEAAESSTLISLPLSVLKREIESNSQMALGMLSAMARYRCRQEQELEHRTLQNAPQRIGCFLLRLAGQVDKAPLLIHLPYDKTLVASRLGMQPETFSRALTRLKEATGMEIRAATIQLKDPERLVRFSCSACSSEFPCQGLEDHTVLDC